MKIKLAKGNRASEAMLLSLQATFGCPLSESFVKFLERNNGAEPEANIFKISEKNESSVNGFIPANRILAERDRIDAIPDNAYPVAWAEGGNYVIVDESKHGVVFFWDHEDPGNTVELAPNFDAFLDLLEPFDINKIELNSQQIKKVWIDPEFLKNLNANRSKD
jgi:hypothetical protein